MKKRTVFSVIALCLFFCGTAVFAQNAAADDPYSFKSYSTEAGRAHIDFSFNDLTGVLRVTYTLKNGGSSFDRGDANTAIRDAVAVFAREHGYFKSRLYTEEDSLELFDNGRSARYKRFFILYEKNDLKK